MTAAERLIARLIAKNAPWPEWYYYIVRAEFNRYASERRALFDGWERLHPEYAKEGA